jgi:hypothetical protein
MLKTTRHDVNAHRTCLYFRDLAGRAQWCDHDQQRGEEAMRDWQATKTETVR